MKGASLALRRERVCLGALQGMFYGASAFNQNVNDWDVGQVTYMEVSSCSLSVVYCVRAF